MCAVAGTLLWVWSLGRCCGYSGMLCHCGAVVGMVAVILYSWCSVLLFRVKYNRIFRDLAVLGYLSQLMLPVTEPLCPLHSLIPYQVIELGGKFSYTDVLEASESR